MKRLLATNAELVDVCDADGYTPLHRACYENQVEAARLLLDKCLNIRIFIDPIHHSFRFSFLFMSIFL